jgi:hypothetical protein
LPATEAAVRRGELSTAQASAITDAAVVNPAAELSLLDAAQKCTLGELRERAARAKAAGDPDPDATHRRIHRQRRVRRYTDDEGGWNIVGRGTADAGAVVNATLDPIIDELFRAARREGRREGRDAYAFDALVELARRARGETQDEASGAARPARPKRSNPSFMALLRVDVEALVRGRVEGDELCEIAGVGPVPAGVARRVLGDSVLKLVITRGVEVQNVRHLGRGPSQAQRIALLWAAPSCTNSACGHTLSIQHDHRTPWSECQETVVGNLDRLCAPCHRRKSHEGWALVEGRGRRPFVPPGDPRHPGHRTSRLREHDPPPAVPA